MQNYRKTEPYDCRKQRRMRLQMLARMRSVWLAALLSLAPFATASSFADDQADCIQREDPDRRIRGCSALIKANPNISEDEYVDRGNAYFAKGDYKRALADFTESIKLEPTLCRGYGYRTMIHIELRKFDLAVADIIKGIEVQPDAEFCRRMLGRALCGSKDYARGVAELTSYMTKFPGGSGNTDQAYIYRGECHEGKGDTAAALADYNAALEHQVSSTAYLARGKFYERLGEKEKAIADYRSALSWRPILYGAKDHAFARERLGKLGVR